MISTSENMSKKLFQIVFNTKKFIEMKSSSSSVSDQYDLSRKLKEMVLTNKTKMSNNEYEYLTEYYFRVAELNSEESDIEESLKFKEFIRNSSFILVYFEYLLNLFKVIFKLNCINNLMIN